ncbi:MAG: PA14 domain-containing protein, partial [Pseudomonadota bacterium]
AENDTGAVVGRLTTIDPDAGDSHSYALSDDRFEVVGDEVRLKPGIALDFEDAAQITLEVTATDTGGQSLTQSFEINVADINEGPQSVTISSTKGGSSSAGLPQEGLVLNLTATSFDGDDQSNSSFRPTVWEDQSGFDHDAVNRGDSTLNQAGDGVDFGGATDEFKIANSSDLNLGNFVEKTFAASFTTGGDVDGFQMVYEQGGSVRGYSLSIAPDPDSGEPSLYAFVWNKAEWSSGDQEKAINLGKIEPNEVYDVVMVHDAKSDDPSERTFSGYLNGEPVETLTQVDMQYRHPGDIAIGNIGANTVHPVTHKVISGNAPFGGEIHEIGSWNLALDEVEVEQVFNHFDFIHDTPLSVSENSAGAVIGHLEVVDPDAGDSHSYALSDDRFEVVGDEVRLKPGIALDFEDAAQITLEVTATDSGGASVTQSFEINVADLNEGPESVSLSNTSVAENTAGAVIGQLDVVDPDANDSHSYALSDDRFEVVDGAVKLKDGVALNHEEAATLNLEVTATDTGGASVTQSFEINVADLNEGPDFITLEKVGVSGLSMNEQGSTDQVAIARDVNDFPTDALSVEIRFQSIDPAPTHGVPLFSYAADDGHNNEFLIWIPNGVNGTVNVFFAGKRIDTGLDASKLLDGEPHDVAVTWDQSEGMFKVFMDGDESFSGDVSTRDLRPGGTITLGQEQDSEGGRFDAQQIFEGMISEVRVFDHARSAEEIAETAGSILPNPATTEGLLINWTMDGAIDGTVKDHAGAHDLDIANGAYLVGVEETSGLQLAENDTGAVVGRLTTIDPDAGDSHSYALSDDRFEVVGDEVRLKPGIALDFEDAAQITLEVTATDTGGQSLTQSFEINVADINEGPQSVSLDGSTIVAGQDGAVIGQIQTTDPDEGDSLSFTLSDDRFEVIDGSVKLKEGAAVSPEEGSVELSVTVTDSGGLSITETFELHVFDPPDVSVSSGFTAEYFDVNTSLHKIDDIDWSSDPTHSEITQEINYTNSGGSFWEGGSKDTFGVKVDGTIEVDEAGTFKFLLGGDDGAMLYVNGVQVIDNDGLHGYQTRTGEIELPEGNHHIEVKYFENYGHAGLKLEWEGPGIEGRQMVEPANDGTSLGIEGISTPLELDISNVSNEAEIYLEGLGAGAVTHLGGQELIADQDGVVNLTGHDISGLSITPPIGSAEDYAPQLKITQAGPDGQDIEVSHPIDIDVTPAYFPATNIEIGGAFQASYFDVDHRLSRLDQIDWDGEPTHAETVSDIDYQNGSGSFWEGGSRDTFGARIEGDIVIEEGGKYDFFVGGDDGVMLFIDGEVVVDNDGLHGFRTRSGDIELEPGEYSIEVRYFENSGNAGLKVEWSGPDTDGRELLKAKPDLEIEQNGSTQLTVDLGDTETTEMITINGMPEDTIVFIDGEVYVSDGQPIDVTGQDLNVLEISPPPGFEGTIEGEITTVSHAFNGQEVSASTPIELTVGDPLSDQTSGPDGPGDLLIMEDSEDLPENAAWTESEAGNENDDGNDVLSEEIADFQVSDNTQEQFDTYERYDW